MPDEELKGIDVKNGLKISGGDAALYARLLKSFAASGLAREFMAALERKDIKAAQFKAHAIKGVAANLGLSVLRAQADSFDAQLKKGVLPDVNGEEAAAMKAAYEEAENSINAVLADPQILEKFKN